MAWRVAGLLIVTGVTFTFLLTGAFVVLGEACLFMAAFAVLVAVESGWLLPADDGDALTRAGAGRLGDSGPSAAPD
jgi:hypothetical protein